MIQLYNGDCLELMKNIPDGSVDLVLTDPPYGTTACKWDSVIPFEPMWEQLNRIIKPNGAICLFCSEPFSSALRMSNIKNFKYDWYWLKSRKTGFLNAKKQPLRMVENISVFYKTQCTYNPQMKSVKERFNKRTGETKCYGKHFAVQSSNNGLEYPFNAIKFKCISHPKHNTQKPVDLLEYLIKTYTNEGETVLDFTMGSGSCGVASVNTNRNFIGIELDKGYFEIAEKRINEAQNI